MNDVDLAARHAIAFAIPKDATRPGRSPEEIRRGLIFHAAQPASDCRRRSTRVTFPAGSPARPLKNRLTPRVSAHRAGTVAPLATARTPGRIASWCVVDQSTVLRITGRS